jgi:hypothetical protein
VWSKGLTADSCCREKVFTNCTIMWKHLNRYVTKLKRKGIFIDFPPSVPVSAMCHLIARWGWIRSPELQELRCGCVGEPSLGQGVGVTSQSRAVSVMFIHAFLCSAHQSTLMCRLQDQPNLGCHVICQYMFSSAHNIWFSSNMMHQH